MVPGRLAVVGRPGRHHGGRGRQSRAGPRRRSSACPAVGLIHSVGVDPRSIEGVAAWGRVAHHAVALSGVVPLLLAVTGPCHGGLAPLLGLADHVVFTEGASAYINGPAAVEALTGLHLTSDALGGPSVHARATGLASLARHRRERRGRRAGRAAVPPARQLAGRAAGRGRAPIPPTARASAAAALVPADPRAAYDVRQLLADVLDRDTPARGARAARHEPGDRLRPARRPGRWPSWPTSPSTGRARSTSSASSKAARHVQAADSANLPILTLVDTPGLRAGQGPRVAGDDPPRRRARARVRGRHRAAGVPRHPQGLRRRLHRHGLEDDGQRPRAGLAAGRDRGDGRARRGRHPQPARDRRGRRPRRRAAAARAASTRSSYCTPRIAAERGYVDAVIDPRDTRAHLVAAFRRLATKRAELPARRHANTPL